MFTEITYLQLEILDISCNCISSLPLELRLMTSLVTFSLEHNPLVSPPATVCFILIMVFLDFLYCILTIMNFRFVYVVVYTFLNI